MMRPVAALLVFLLFVMVAVRVEAIGEPASQRSNMAAKAGSEDTAAEVKPMLGRLFTTPGERDALNIARQRVLRKKLKGAVRKGVIKHDFQETITLDGFVLRSNGPPAIWMNGKSALRKDAALPKGVAFSKVGEVPGVEVEVKLGKRKRKVKLKTGQRMDGDSGMVLEHYEHIQAPKDAKSKNSKAADKKKKQQAAKKKKAKKASTSAKFDESSLEDMMKKREAFAEKIGFMNKILGQ